MFENIVAVSYAGVVFLLVLLIALCLLMLYGELQDAKALAKDIRNDPTHGTTEENSSDSL